MKANRTVTERSKETDLPQQKITRLLMLERDEQWVKTTIGQQGMLYLIKLKP